MTDQSEAGGKKFSSATKPSDTDAALAAAKPVEQPNPHQASGQPEKAADLAPAVAPAAAPQPPEKAALRLDGPTFEEYVAKGYGADTYPPLGYAEIGSVALEQYRATGVLPAKPPTPNQDRALPRTYGQELDEDVARVRAAHAGIRPPVPTEADTVFINVQAPHPFNLIEGRGKTWALVRGINRLPERLRGHPGLKMHQCTVVE